MMNIRRLKKAVIACSMCFVITGASATTITYEDSWDFDSISIVTRGSIALSVHDSLRFMRFDEELGSLTGVDLRFTSNWKYRSGVSTSSSFYTARVKGSGISSFALSFFLFDPDSAVATMSDSEYSGCSRSSSSSSGVSGCSQFENNAGAFNQTLDLSSISLEAFINPVGNDVQVQLTERFDAFIISCGAQFCRQFHKSNDWQGTAYLTYTYNEPVKPVAESTEVSEPGALFLIAVGLVGLSFSRRNKRHQLYFGIKVLQSLWLSLWMNTHLR